MDIKVCKDTGNEEISIGSGEIDNSIRLMYIVRKNQVNVVANTKIGFVSGNMGHKVTSHKAPWSDGRIVESPDGVSLSISEKDYADVVNFLDRYNINTVEVDENS